MPHVLKMKDGKLLTPFGIRDLLDAVQDYAGEELCREIEEYIETNVQDIDEMCIRDRYEVDGSHTVMAVDRCNDYRYDFTDGTYEVIPAEAFEDVEWSVRLLMEGERRMEHRCV